MTEETMDDLRAELARAKVALEKATRNRREASNTAVLASSMEQGTHRRVQALQLVLGVTSDE